MLKNIPAVFTPDLLSLMMKMGHGEELLICDGNYPMLTTGKESIPRIHLPVEKIDGLLADVLKFFPLDEKVTYPAAVMEISKETGVYDGYNKILTESGYAGKIKTLERFSFYEKAQNAAGIVVTADTRAGANILLKKGVVRP